MKQRGRFENTDCLIDRRNLSGHEVFYRLSSIYDEETVNSALLSAMCSDVWVDCDRHVAVICTTNDKLVDNCSDDRFVILATGHDYSLVE